MSLYYEIRAAGNQDADDLASNLVQISAQEADTSTLPLVKVLTPAQFCDLGIDDCKDLMTFDSLADAESNFVDIYQNYIMGSFSVPSRSIKIADPDTFAFYMDRKQLVFVDKGDVAQGILKQIEQGGVIRTMSTSHCLYVFMKDLMSDDLDFMSQVEDKMEDIEEAIMSTDLDLSASQIMNYRRLSMRFVTFYQQLATMAAMIGDDENKMMSHDEARQFDHLENLADRLANRATALREYSLQLHELHQTRIDLRQNATMQILTIVTVIIAPMTLVTGWFGMNLQVLPGLSFSFMWIVLIAAFILCIVLLLLLFHRKRWI